MSVQALLIGIGSGNPDHLTREAVAALNRVEVFLVADKGESKQDLVMLRRQLCDQLIGHDRYRLIEVTDPERGPDASRDGEQYRAAVREWHDSRARQLATIISTEVGPDGVVGFLVWGDPALYDSTIRVVESIRDAGGIPLTMTVIPGISSLSLLAARHRISLNRVGQPVHITTGRRLVAEYHPDLGDVAVMLDGGLACRGLVDRYPDLTIFWAAQLGLDDEVVRHGRLADVLEDIAATRAEVRQRRGWVMDSYLLRP